MARRSHYNSHKDIDPDEIFLDDKNIPDFDVQQFEGRIETPISRSTIFMLGAGFLLLGMGLLFRTGTLQLIEGKAYAVKSEQNRLDHQYLFPERGIVADRNGIQLAWNTPSTEELGFSLRRYTALPGFSHILGFLHYPARDKHGVYYRTDYEAAMGVELYYDTMLKGEKGLRIIETDALGNVMSANVIDPPIEGGALTLTIDSRLQSKLYNTISAVARERDFRGGAAGIMDISTGELLALVSYPEFDSNVLTEGEDRKVIVAYNSDPATPYLNRTIQGLYTPGSIVKPIFALGGLNEGIITPQTLILSTGQITVPNPYFPDKESVFTDTARGLFDVRGALEQSSNVFFYEVAGGYKNQKGLGIERLEKYARMFGFASTTGIDLYGEAKGTIPNPEWKEMNFPGDQWRIGDTYFTGIGQYGVQVTPLQALREASIIASKGDVVTPHLWMNARASTTHVDIPEAYFTVVHEGMRRAATVGTALLNIPGVKFAAKSGTAELGVSKTRVNSWVIGFFPYDNPRYAFAVVMERGPKGNTMNATYVARQFFTWMASSTPEYFLSESE